MKSIEFDHGRFEVLKALLKAAHKVGVPVALIGASARDVMLVGLHNIQPARKTMDVDCAAKVNDWQHYKKLRTFMLNNMGEVIAKLFLRAWQHVISYVSRACPSTPIFAKNRRKNGGTRLRVRSFAIGSG